jgi:hypothetical protein
MLARGGIPRSSRHNVGMRRLAKWLFAALVLLVLLFAGVAVALQYWVGSADFRGRAAQQASAALGVPVEFGALTVDLWPVPAVAVDRLQVRTRPAITLERVEARPRWQALLQGRLEIATLVVRNAVIPEQTLAVLAAGAGKKGDKAQSSDPSRTMAMLPRRAILDGVTWVWAKGGRSTVDAQLGLAADGLPQDARIEVREGRFQGSKAALDRAPEGHWSLRADLGGGTVKGRLQLQPRPKGAPLLVAQLATAGVEVAALTAPSRTLTGRIDANTTLRADLGAAGSLVDGVHSETRFTVRNAVVHGLDLARAVKTIGLSRGGETALDTLAGQVVTRGRSVQLSNLVATSGLLSATGSVAIAPSRALSGRITVDLAASAAGGAFGVPLAVGGTLDAPSVTLTRGALLGAALGTAVAPGVGTGAGAKLGDQIGESLRGLFGK